MIGNPLTARPGVGRVIGRAPYAALLALLPALIIALGSAAPARASVVRLARFSVIEGDVSWRPSNTAAWSQAAINLPVRQGYEIAVPSRGRCELQFDDGSRLECARGAVVTLNNLYSDNNGEFTNLGVRNGTVALLCRHNRSVYQVDTPLVSFDAAGPARFRIDAVDGVACGVRGGRVVIDGDPGRAALVKGNYVMLRNAHDPYNIVAIPPHDDFDDWWAGRCSAYDRYMQSPDYRRLPANIAIAADNLSDYGDWRTDPRYGRVWHPRVRQAGWRPYRDGHWTWVAPYGWTWVADEPWGWAPSHYGTWIHRDYGWCWVPGPRHQYWSPAVVSFTEYNNDVAWCPIAPTEIQYPPSLSVGFNGGDWSDYFSIGSTAVYYPTSRGYYRPRPWSTTYVNNVTYVRNVNDYYAPTLNRNRYLTNYRYVPLNARLGGASIAAVSAFGGYGAYRELRRDPRLVFTRGRTISEPIGRFAPAAGPIAARPSVLAASPSRNVRRADPAPSTVLRRPVNRASRVIRDPVAARQAFARVPVARGSADRNIAARPGTPAVDDARTRVPIRPLRVPVTATRPVPVRPNAARPRAVGRPNGGWTREQIAAAHARSALGRPTGLPKSAAGIVAGQRPGQTVRDVVRRPTRVNTARVLASGRNSVRRDIAAAQAPRRPTSPAQRAALARTAVATKRNDTRPTSNRPLRAYRAPRRNTTATAGRPTRPSTAQPERVLPPRRSVPPTRVTQPPRGAPRPLAVHDRPRTPAAGHVRPVQHTRPPVRSSGAPTVRPDRPAPTRTRVTTLPPRRTPAAQQRIAPQRVYRAPVRTRTSGAPDNRQFTRRPPTNYSRPTPPVRTPVRQTTPPATRINRSTRSSGAAPTRQPTPPRRGTPPRQDGRRQRDGRGRW